MKMRKINLSFALSDAMYHLEKRGVHVLVYNSKIKGYSIHDFGKEIRALIILKKDTYLKMLLVLAHEVGHLFDVSKSNKMMWRPRGEEFIANKRAVKLLKLIDPSLVPLFRAHYKKSLKERLK